jgi:hypothetical protein
MLANSTERYAQVCVHVTSLLCLSAGDHRKGNGSQIRLDHSLDLSSTIILYELGLSVRCGEAAPKFDAQWKTNETRRDADRKTQDNQDQKNIKERIQSLGHSLPFWFVHQTARLYPYVSVGYSYPTCLSDIKGQCLRKHCFLRCYQNLQVPSMRNP